MFLTSQHQENSQGLSTEERVIQREGVKWSHWYKWKQIETKIATWSGMNKQRRNGN